MLPAAPTTLLTTTPTVASTASSRTPAASTPEAPIPGPTMLHHLVHAVCSIAKFFELVAEKYGLMLDAKRADNLAILRTGRDEGILSTEAFK